MLRVDLPRRIDDVFQDSRLRLIQIQLRSPFGVDGGEITPFKKPGTAHYIYQWTNDRHVERRQAKVAGLLDALRLQEHLRKGRTVIAFPEYAVPKACHELLRRYADEHGCIVVAGSYYEDSFLELDTFRSNVCKIYIPGQEPVVIVKKHPYRDEAHCLGTSTLPNVARLQWKSAELRTEIAIRIFLCRDYLLPFSGPMTNDARPVSELDWEYPGMSLVVMCSDRTALFEAQAAFEVRRLWGKGKVVALCNCSGIGVERNVSAGTAFLGPSTMRAQQLGDVVERLPGSEEGILVTDTKFQLPMGVQKTSPDVQTTQPIENIESYVLDEEGGVHALEGSDRVKFIELPEEKGIGLVSDQQAQLRGIWHPAFLKLAKRRLVIHLLGTRQYSRVEKTFAQDFRRVFGVGVIGKHDLVVRTYERNDEDNQLSDTIYTALKTEDFNELFPEERRVKIVVEPKRMIKYRSQIIPPAEEWAAVESKIRDVIGWLPGDGRSSTLKTICRLARNWDDPDLQSEKQDLADVFLPEQEHVYPTDSIVNGALRQRYIMISLKADESAVREYEKDVVRRHFAPIKEIRSIFRIKVEEGDGEGYFHFWLDMVAPIKRCDAICKEISAISESKRSKANSMRFDVGTRSMDVLDFLLNQSVEAIANIDSDDVLLAFHRAIGEVDEEALKATKGVNDTRLFNICAEHWSEQVETPTLSHRREARRQITSFYAYWVLAHGTQDTEKRERYLGQAGDHWRWLFRAFEDECKRAIAVCLELDEKDEVEASADRFLIEKLGERSSEQPRKTDVGRLMSILPLSKKGAALGEKLEKSSLKHTLDHLVKRIRGKVTHSNKDTNNLLDLTNPFDPMNGNAGKKESYLPRATGTLIAVREVLLDFNKQDMRKSSSRS
ncbi:MAG: hypothetical protein AB7E79_13045 [Rhodospirillaceae bacterium]